MKKTKIICSIGPSSVNPDVMEQMVNNGMNVARINLSHATIEERENVVKSVKEVREKTKKNIAILYDTKGPEFRNGEMLNGEVELVSGKTIKIVKEDIIGTDEDCVFKRIEKVVDNQLIKESIEKLNRRERKIMELRFGFNGTKEKTQKEVADMLRNLTKLYIKTREKNNE